MQQHESWVDRRVREAQERGVFDDLPGAGKPIEGLDRPYDPDWWIKGLIEREKLDLSAALPPTLALRRESEDLMDTLADVRSERHVREIVTDLNGRILAEHRRPSPGPWVYVPTLDVDEVVRTWRTAR
ncbi:MAG: DUF1992 domain-containing protein [Nocardioidaceae bacterium]